MTLARRRVAAAIAAAVSAFVAVPVAAQTQQPSGPARARPSATSTPPDLPVDPAQAWQRCQAIAESRARLDCYDAWARAVSTPAEAAQADAVQQAPQQLPLVGSSGIWSTFWELEDRDKHGTFNVKTYRPNFILPLRWSSYINNRPATPTQPAAAGGPSYQSSEAKLQLSLRAKLIEGIGPSGADLWFGYTQVSQWQVWNRSESSPFRNTDYEAELVYVTPVPRSWQALPAGWRWSLLQAGLSHQSNGQTAGLSRSWNRVYIGTGVEKGPVAVHLTKHFRLPERDGKDDNPDLTQYIGWGELGVGWFGPRATAQWLWRPSFDRASRGSMQVNLTYPFRVSQPQGLRWYLQWFNGYGESLIDYNVRQQSLGFGVSLFEF